MDADGGNVEMLDAAVEADLLPPLPLPHPNRRQQVRRGVCLVLFVATLVTTIGEVTARLIAPGTATRTLATVVEALVVVAVLCFSWLCYSTAHLLQRTAQTAYPIPPEVSEALARQTSIRGAGPPSQAECHHSPAVLGLPAHNLKGEDGRTYCVRCLLWRPAGVASHHCRVCNRCCVRFDHHCHILGRCVGGSGLTGNILPFRLLLVSTAIGVVVCIGTVLASVMRLLTVDPEHDAAALTFNASTEEDRHAELIAASWSQGARLGLGLGGIAGMLLLLVLSCKIIARMCQGAKQLSERAQGAQLSEQAEGSNLKQLSERSTA